MNKVIAACALVTFFYACGQAPVEVKSPISVSVNPQIGVAQKASAAPADSAGSKTGAIAAAPEKDGKVLLEGADCRACHQDKTKLVGPAYADVAKKYKASDIKKLAQKVIDGGTGVWGQIPMAPHVTLSHEDAEAMVKYILTIK